MYFSLHPSWIHRLSNIYTYYLFAFHSHLFLECFVFSTRTAPKTKNGSKCFSHEDYYKIIR